ncbi:MAG: hypothetical protein R3F61_08630 [Myxococcota bacterium]
MTLTLADTWQPWHPSVRRGVLDEGEGPVDVFAVLAPWQPSGVARAREQAGRALTLEAPDILRLLDIRGHNQRVAYVYEAVDGIALATLTGPRELGHRAAAELLAATALSVAKHAHPGPEPEDVLLCRDGTTRLANFVRPFPGIGGPRAPGKGSTEATQVYRLGALLAYLLGGPLPTTSTPDAHEAAVRRAQIRAMSRPGAVFSESYGNWLRALLAWNPADRPPLSRVIDGFGELAGSTAGPTLRETCEEQFDAWMISLVGSDPEETTLPADWDSALAEVVNPLPTAEAGRRTLGDDQVMGDLTAEDDPTVDSELGVVPEYTPPSIIERGSIPVAVGPPAEVAAKRPSLPDGFLHDPEGETRTHVMSEPEETGRPAWLIWVGVVLVGLAVGMAFWLAFG